MAFPGVDTHSERHPLLLVHAGILVAFHVTLQIVGQTRPVGQYFLHSLAMFASQSGNIIIKINRRNSLNIGGKYKIIIHSEMFCCCFPLY